MDTTSTGKPSTGPPFARRDKNRNKIAATTTAVPRINKTCNMRRHQKKRQQQQKHLTTEGRSNNNSTSFSGEQRAGTKTSSLSSAVSSLPVLVSPPQHRLIPVDDDSIWAEPSRNVWVPAAQGKMSPAASSRGSSSASSIASSSSSTRPPYPDSARLQNSTFSRLNFPLGDENNNIGQQEKSIAPTSFHSGVKSAPSSPPSSRRMMEQCLAILSSHDDEQGAAYSQTILSPPYSSADKDEQCLIYRGIDNLLARSPPNFDEMSSSVAGVDRVSGGRDGGKRSNSEGTGVAGLRRGGGASSLPDVLLGATYNHTGNNKEASDHGIQDASKTVAAACRGKGSDDEDSDDRIIMNGESVKSFARRRRRRGSNTSTQSGSGTIRRSSINICETFQTPGGAPGGGTGKGTSSDRQHHVNSFTATTATNDSCRRNYYGMDSALLAEAFAFADQAAKEETAERAALKTYNDTSSTSSNVNITTSNIVPQDPRGRGRLRRTQSMGAALNSAPSRGGGEKGGGGGGGGARPAAAMGTMLLGEKYDNSNGSTLTENWVRGTTGGKLPHSTGSFKGRGGYRPAAARGGDVSSSSHSTHSTFGRSNLELDGDFGPGGIVGPSARRDKREAWETEQRKDCRYLHHNSEEPQEISLRSPERSVSGGDGSSRSTRRGREDEKCAPTIAEMVERLETGAGVAELKAELKESQASLQRSSQAIGQAASRWHQPHHPGGTLS